MPQVTLSRDDWYSVEQAWINYMYCPPFHSVKKDLTDEEKELIEDFVRDDGDFDKFLRDTKKEITLFDTENGIGPREPTLVTFGASEEVLRLLFYIFESFLKESETDNGYELKVLTGVSLERNREVLEHFRMAIQLVLLEETRTEQGKEEEKTHTVLTLHHVTLEKMRKIHALGMETDPEFWGGYVENEETLKNIEKNSSVTFDFSSETWEDTLREIQDLFLWSAETFMLMRSLDVTFKIDVRFVDVIPFSERNWEFNLNVTQNWYGFWAYHGMFCVSFFSSDCEMENEEEDEEEISLKEDRKKLEKRWFRASFLDENRKKEENL